MSYKKGYRKERRVMELLKKQGYVYVTRTPKSSTPIDVIALKPLEVKLIQVKYGNSRLSKEEKENLKKLKSDLFSNIYTIEVWHFKKNKKLPEVLRI